MGGSAFATGEDPLWTPRMPKAVYENVKSRCHASLMGIYSCVASPIDGPGKTDFGDIDILVAWPKGVTTTKEETLNTIATALKATRVIADKGKIISAHFALEWPDEHPVASSRSVKSDLNGGLKLEPSHDAQGFSNGLPPLQVPLTENTLLLHTLLLQTPGLLEDLSSNDFRNMKDQPDEHPHQAATHQLHRTLPIREKDTTALERAIDSNKSQQTPEALGPKRYIQVDVRVCETLDQLQWILFKHAHGDIWNLLGTTIRPFGLTVDECALWLRIPEIEHHNRNRAKVFLSARPGEILQFLGLPIGRYWEEPFEDLTAMYEYVAQCRLFWVPPANPENEEAGDIEQLRKNLKANDRRRMNQRPGFRKWIEEFKPLCREEGRFLERPATREEVIEEAFSRWPAVENEYKRRRHTFLLEQNINMISNKVIKGAIPEVEAADTQAVMYRSIVVKAFKKIILLGDESYGVVAGDDLKDDQGLFVAEDVVDFIARNQEAVEKVAIKRQQDSYREHMARKAEE